MSPADETRDELIARVLRDLPVPDHGPTFWDDLDLRLGDPVKPAAARPVDPGVHRLDTGELPSVAALSAGRRGRRSRRAPVLAVAAAIVLVVAAVGVVTLLGDGDDDPTELADQPDDTDTSQPARDTPTTASLASTTTTAPATSQPDGAVAAWLQAIGSGDVAAAAALTGPVTTAYLTAAADGVEAYLTESQEGYGAWADVAEITYAVIPVGPVTGIEGSVAVVVVSGPNRGEGREEPITTDVFPVVDRGDGWRVEPVAASPERDGNIPIIQSPRAPTGQDGIGSMDGDAAIEVIVPAPGTVVFRIDELEPFQRATTGVGSNDDPYARYDPAGTLAGGAHTLVVVGFGDDGTIAAFAGPFTVTGGAPTTTTSTTSRGTGTTSTTRPRATTTTTAD